MYKSNVLSVPRVAVIGSGYWGKNLVRNYYSLESLTLICDQNETVLDQFKQQYPDVQTCMAFSDVLAREDIQGVVIATPAETHYSFVKEALLAGKHVYVEKPLVLKAHIFVSWLNPFKDQKLVVVGEAGMAVFEDSLPGPEKLLFYPHTVTRQEDVPSLERAEPEPLPYPDEEPLKAECQHFLDSVTAGSPPRTDGREGARVLTVLEAAQHAMETGHRVCPPAGEAPGVARDASPHPAAATLAPDAAVGANTRI